MFERAVAKFPYIPCLAVVSDMFSLTPIVTTTKCVWTCVFFKFVVPWLIDEARVFKSGAVVHCNSLGLLCPLTLVWMSSKHSSNLPPLPSLGWLTRWWLHTLKDSTRSTTLLQPAWIRWLGHSLPTSGSRFSSFQCGPTFDFSFWAFGLTNCWVLQLFKLTYYLPM